jgi:hypothetical protein
VNGTCDKHEFDPAIDVCGRCLREFCGECVVYPFGTAELPYCVTCAVDVSGVRTGSKLPPLTRRQRRLALDRRRELRERHRPS